MSMSGVKRLNITLTEKQWKQLDKFWKEQGYASRSEFIRELIRLRFGKNLPMKKTVKKLRKKPPKVKDPKFCKHGAVIGLCKHGCKK